MSSINKAKLRSPLSTPILVRRAETITTQTMTILISKIRIAALLCSVSFLSFSALGGDTKDANSVGGGQNKIEIKDFAFNPQTITVKSGQTIIWINRDEEPHTVVSVEKQFKKSSALDTDQEFTITTGAPGTYTYFCSVHPKMTGTIVVTK
jgi:plastocyanin